MKNTDEAIERSIAKGLITDGEYLEKIAKVENLNQYLISDLAKRLSKWCLDYFSKYGEAPGKNLEGLYFEKLKSDNLPQDVAEDIELFLEDLSDEYEKQGEFNIKYLLDRTYDYFIEQHVVLHRDQTQHLLDEGKAKEAQQLQDMFKPLMFEEKTEGFTPSELYKMKITQPKFLIERLMPVGLTIIAGKSNVGKSYKMLNIAMAMANRTPVFGEFNSTNGQILYLSLEDPKARFIRRMRDIVKGNPDFDPNWKKINKRMEIHFEWEKLDRGGLTRLKNWIERAQKPKLIVIDTIGMIWDKSEKTSGAGLYAEEKRIFGELAKLAHDYEISIVLLHHTTKEYKADPFDEILGGAGMEGSCDTKMVMHRKPNKPVELYIKSRDLERKHWAFEVSEKGARWEWLGDAQEVQKTDERQDIFDYIRQAGADGVRYSDIVQASKDGIIQAATSSIKLLVRKMTASGKLVQPKSRGRYYVPEEYQNRANKKVRMKLME